MTTCMNVHNNKNPKNVYKPCIIKTKCLLVVMRIDAWISEHNFGLQQIQTILYKPYVGYVYLRP